jgi:hypothetical protein
MKSIMIITIGKTSKGLRPSLSINGTHAIVVITLTKPVDKIAY